MIPPEQLTTVELLRAATDARTPADYRDACQRELARRIDRDADVVELPRPVVVTRARVPA